MKRSLVLDHVKLIVLAAAICLIPESKRFDHVDLGKAFDVVRHSDRFFFNRLCVASPSNASQYSRMPADEYRVPMSPCR